MTSTELILIKSKQFAINKNKFLVCHKFLWLSKAMLQGKTAKDSGYGSRSKSQNKDKDSLRKIRPGILWEQHSKFMS